MEKLKICSEEQLNMFREQTDLRIKEIRSTPDIKLSHDADVRYVSPDGNDANDGLTPQNAWKSLERVNNGELKAGCFVLFERGGFFRGQLNAKEGVTYSAYTVASKITDKPILSCSPFDGADPSLWSPSGKPNIWTISLGSNDVGTLVFNNGEKHAVKWRIMKVNVQDDIGNMNHVLFNSWEELNGDLHFYHDLSSGILYLYSRENPGERFESIEFSMNPNCINVKGDNAVIDNLCIKYVGMHGIGAGTRNGLTVQNCELGWIGGGITPGRDGGRLGNAIEIYGGCDSFKVNNCYIYQVYDAGITQQYNFSEADNQSGRIVNQCNMTYTNNVIEYCNYSIEYFLKGIKKDNPSSMKNFNIANNLMWYAGYGFCEQRPNANQAAHIKSWASKSLGNRATEYVVKGNLMCCTKDMLVQIHSGVLNPDGSSSMPKLENNTFVGAFNGRYGFLCQGDPIEYTYDLSISDKIDGIGNKFLFR